MLVNTLKKLVFLARSTKKPSPQPLVSNSDDPESASQGFSHPISPTLKKIEKRYNQSVRK